jgi:hypothetical protein
MSRPGKALWIRLVAIGAGLAAIGAGIAAYDELRPYATRGELALVGEKVQQVAGRSCKNELSFYAQELRDIDRQLERAIAESNTSWARTLREQRLEVLAEITRVKRECGWP